MDLPTSSCGCSFVDTPFLAGVCGPSFALFMSLVEYIIKGQCDLTDPCQRLGVKNAPDAANNNYDFIVVGAGVAGPVVAGRLSEVPEWKVLLLEAGPEEPTATMIPAFVVSAIGTPLDWNYTTEPSSVACLSNGGHCKWPRGRMVSGTSGMEGSMYTRPHSSIFEGWAENNPGWGPDDVLPYFIKSENNLNPELVDAGYHGFSGPMPIQTYPSHPKLSEDVVEAGKYLGYRNGDLSGKNQTGTAIAQQMVLDGMRASTARMYLRPYVDSRANLKVGINSQVTKILINPDTKVASGVQYADMDGNIHTVYAKKEVILAAGAVNSPQLLLLSGVGPRADLESVGVDVIVDLPGVGQNLQNHVATSIAFSLNETGSASLTLESLQEFINKRTGNMSSNGVTQTTLFMKSKYVADEVPDLQIFFNGYSASCSRTGAAEECDGTGQLGNCPNRHVAARPTNILPRSKGFLKLKSSNPFDHPLIYPHYLQDQHDVDVLVEGIKLAIKLANTPPLQKYGFTVDQTPVAGCEDYTFGSDLYFSCVVRMNTGPENHQAGSCKMGPASDKMAVVDNELKVHGVPNIRVADASVFPTNPNCNPTSVIIMAAEKLADMAKTAWKDAGVGRTIPEI